jgi:hypothetical protein
LNANFALSILLSLQRCLAVPLDWPFVSTTGLPTCTEIGVISVGGLAMLYQYAFLPTFVHKTGSVSVVMQASGAIREDICFRMFFAACLTPY